MSTACGKIFSHHKNRKIHKERQLIAKGRHSGNKLREVAPTRCTDQKREEIFRKLIRKKKRRGQLVTGKMQPVDVYALLCNLHSPFTFLKTCALDSLSIVH